MDDLELLAAFTTWQRGRSFAQTTLRRRETSLRSFRRYIAPVALTDNATPGLIEEWLASLRTARTRHAYRSDLRVFYMWAFKRDLITMNPTARIDPVRVPRSLPRPVNTSQVAEIIARADDPDTRLMVALAACAGLRRFEIARLASDDLSLHAKPPMLVVRNGKGAKDRLVPLHPFLVHLLRERRPQGRLFGCNAQTVGRRIARHLAACGVIATPHQLRHSFGTELARVTGGNVVLVQALMGHSTPTTTMGYIGWNGDGAGPVGEMYGS